MEKEKPFVPQESIEKPKERKIFNVSLLTGELTPEAREEAVNEMHISAFDYYHPVNNFLYHIGMQDSRRFINMVEEGVGVEANEDVKSAAKEFIDRWIQLIKDVKGGKEVKTGPTILGKIPIHYDKENIEEKNEEGKEFRKDDLRRHVHAICELAGLDVEQVLREMLE